MFKHMRFLLISSVFIVACLSSWADTPSKIDTPDDPSIENMGKIDLYVAQKQTLEIKQDKEKMDTEVLITFETKPGVVYTVKPHPDSRHANKGLADALRDAYSNQADVTLYNKKGLAEQEHVKIHMLQLDEE